MMTPALLARATDQVGAIERVACCCDCKCRSAITHTGTQITAEIRRIARKLAMATVVRQGAPLMIDRWTITPPWRIAVAVHSPLFVRRFNELVYVLVEFFNEA